VGDLLIFFWFRRSAVSGSVDDPAIFYGRKWWSIWPERSQDLVREHFETALSGRPTSFEAACPTAKGNPRRWLVKLKPLCAKSGPVVSVVVTSREIPYPGEA
jgi:hypothetical protein